MELPPDDPAILARPDLFHLEDEISGGGDPLPEIETGLAPIIARTIGRGCRVFEHAAFADQIVEVFGAVLLEGRVETSDDRALDTATRLFYAEGIRGVGIDRIIAEASVAKATFYNHFPSKDDLVLAYIEEQDQLGRSAVAAIPAQPPRKMIAAIVGRISDAAVGGDFRGCPFLNAAAEYSDPKSPVRQAIDTRRTWYHGLLQKLLAADGDPTPPVTASLLVAVSDGLLEIAYLDDPKNVPGLVSEALERLLARR